jgi:hypothetical protein
MTKQIIVNNFVNTCGFMYSMLIRNGLTGDQLKNDVIDLLTKNYKDCENYTSEQYSELADDCISALYGSEWFK